MSLQAEHTAGCVHCGYTVALVTNTWDETPGWGLIRGSLSRCVRERQENEHDAG